MGSHRLPAALLALLLVLSMLTACGGGGASAAGMRLRKTEGTVAVQDDGGADITPKENLNLYSGYDVVTQAASYAWIDLEATKLTMLDESSEVAVTQDGKALTLDVLTGSLYFNVTEPLAEDETLDIRTSTMVTGIRGTRGWVTQQSVCLLEGTVTVTGGEQSVTVTAGQMARLTPDGTLETAPLTYQDMPAFVKAETPAPAEGDALPATYEEQLAMLDGLVYAEMVDFEQDGEPELLAVSVEPRDNSVPSAVDFGYGLIDIYIYRQEAGGVRRLGGQGDNMYQEGTVSLVERDGRQYVSFYHWHENSEPSQVDGGFVYYIGSAVPANGGDPAWGSVEAMQIQYAKTDGRVTYFWLYPTAENGHMDSENPKTYLDLGYSWADETDEACETEMARYTPVRDLLSYNGADITTYAP